MRRLLCFAAFVAAGLVLAVSAKAQSLAIDFQPTGGTTQAGFQAYEETNQVLPDGTGTDYAAFGTTVNVAVTAANLPDGNLDFRAVTRNGATSAGEKENDWLGVDTRTGGVDVTLTVTVSGLPAGFYSWFSTHHDGGSDATNGNLNGVADYEFIDASGSSGLIADGIIFSEQDELEPISAFSQLFVSDGSPVSLSIIMDNGQGDPLTDNNALFAFINSVEITAVPEPGALALVGCVSFGLGMIRRRRQA